MIAGPASICPAYVRYTIGNIRVLTAVERHSAAETL